MDGLSLYAVSRELQGLIGGKIEKVQQPERDVLLLTVRAGGSSQKLLLYAHPENGRVQLTGLVFQNPAEAPAFCMLLRKRITGGRILKIEQPSLDRALHIWIEARDELGDIVESRLIIELMGKHSNIIFTNGEGTVQDCTKHVNAAMSSVRLVLPGVPYVLPPQQDKINPLEAGEEDFFIALQERGAIYKSLSKRFFGLAPGIAKEIVAKWAGEQDIAAESLREEEKRALAHYLCNLYGAFREGKFSPTIVYNEAKEPVEIYPFQPGMPTGMLKTYSTMGEALDAFYKDKDAAERIKRRGASLSRLLQNQLERGYKKLMIYEQALHSGEDLERLRLYGELLIAQAHELRRGMEHGKLMNYYAEPPEICIVPLDKRLSPQENAQRYFKRYQKGKAARELAAGQYKETAEEIAYLEGQQDNLKKCSTNTELVEIREELVREGYAKPESRKSKAKEQKHAPSKPLHLLSSDGLHIYVGKNNRQNDTLTLKFARSEDWWLHTKDIPGSHVIIRAEGELPEATLKEAAMVAAWYSKARASASVPVDYALRKYVKKPGGAKPGMVIYTNNHTMYCTPDEVLVKNMKQVED